jgi:hypothetical protein
MTIADAYGASIGGVERGGMSALASTGLRVEFCVYRTQREAVYVLTTVHLSFRSGF